MKLDYNRISPEGIAALGGLSSYVAKTVDRRLRALVELRVSQINGCAYCLNLHTQEARAAGETQQRLDVLSAWRETAFFDDKEQAALAWAESVTRLGEHGVPEAVHATMSARFSEKEIVDLTLAIAAMNAWNRISLAFGNLPPKRD